MPQKITNNGHCILFIFFNLVLGTSAFTGLCVDVIDGDTILVIHDGHEQKIRLYGIDAPERGRGYYLESKKFLSNLVLGNFVKVQPYGQDRYGRTIGIIFLGDLNVNREIVKSGYSWVYRKYCTKAFCNEWLDMETTARQNGLGLWKQWDSEN